MGLCCDVFCRVVDNFGDAAVAWRLARNLAQQHGYAVRLLIDHPAVLAPLLGMPADFALPQEFEGVELRVFEDTCGRVAQLIIETFGCGLPEAYLKPLGARASQATLINVEYLSAESWPDDVHGLSSPPRDGLPTRHFFFPGYSSATGGLLRESDLAARRDQALGDEQFRMRFFAQLGVDIPAHAPARVVSLFCYDHGFAPDWLRNLVGLGRHPLHLIIAQGVQSLAVEAFCGSCAAGTTHQIGDVRVSVIPFLPQREFDALMWSCDANLVRGEDSFVRAQLAGKPMLWDIYPQDDAAHLVKLEAYVTRYTADWKELPAREYRVLGDALIQRAPEFGGLFRQWCDRLPEFTLPAKRWLKNIEMLPELTSELAIFAGKLLK